MSVTTVIGIPGKWNDREELMRSIAGTRDGYVLILNHMHNLHDKSEPPIEVELYEHEPAMREAFRYAGKHTFTEEQLEQIDQHTQTVYLIGPGGSPENLARLTRAATAVLKAGGLGVKIESTGLAHTPENWLHFVNSNYGDLRYLFLYVTYLQNEQGVYSVGMQNLGLPEAIISLEEEAEPQDALDQIQSFLTYLVMEKPAMLNGDTFSLKKSAPRYEVTREYCTFWPSDDLFHNPFGYWRLSRQKERMKKLLTLLKK